MIKFKFDASKTEECTRLIIFASTGNFEEENTIHIACELPDDLCTIISVIELHVNLLLKDLA